MKLKLIIFCFLLSLPGLGQKKLVALKFSPLSSVDEISFPTIQTGIEISLGKRISWYNEFGVKYRKGYYENTDTSFHSSKGFKAKSEFRYYIKDIFTGKFSRRLQGMYVAANFFLTKDFHNTSIKYFYLRDTSSVRQDNFGIKKTVVGGNLLVGQQQSMGKHLMLDLYAGLGIRFLDVKANNKEFNYYRDGLILPVDLNVPALSTKTDARAGKSVRPNLTMGIRFCYLL